MVAPTTALPSVAEIMRMGLLAVRQEGNPRVRRRVVICVCCVLQVRYIKQRLGCCGPPPPGDSQTCPRSSTCPLGPDSFHRHRCRAAVAAALAKLAVLARLPGTLCSAWRAKHKGTWLCRPFRSGPPGPAPAPRALGESPRPCRPAGWRDHQTDVQPLRSVRLRLGAPRPLCAFPPFAVLFYLAAIVKVPSKGRK